MTEKKATANVQVEEGDKVEQKVVECTDMSCEEADKKIMQEYGKGKKQ